MWNLIKYEIKGYYKELSILAGCIVFLNLLLFTRIGVWPREAITGFSIMIVFISIIIVFIWNIALYSRDLYADTGYLLFSLPQKGWTILTAKLLASLAQMTAIQLLGGVFVFFNLTRVQDFEMGFNVFKEAVSFQAVIYGILTPIYWYLCLVVFIYFCITIGKVAIGRRKLGKLGAFISFVILSIITGKLSDILYNSFPQGIHINAITPKGYLMLNQFGGVLPSHDITINIAMILFDIIMFAVYFATTSYLLENKINL